MSPDRELDLEALRPYPDPLCAHTVIDRDGIEQPCERPATSHRWYQDVDEHEPMLTTACDWHENEGGRRMAALIAALDSSRERELDRIAITAPDGRSRPLCEVPDLVAIVALTAMPDRTVAAVYTERRGQHVDRDQAAEALVNLGLDLPPGPAPHLERNHDG